MALVQDAKRLLMKEVEEQLQQYYGVRPDGTVLMIEQLTTSDSDFIYTARVLRQRIDYIKTNLPDKKNEDIEAVRQLVREQAFTILNRFASLRMAEERGIIKETVRKEYNSEGFQVFDSITGKGQTASQYMRYKWYIHAIFDELALDLPSVFDRYSPYALIFPSEQAMNRLLDIINREEITLHREEGLQAVNLWKEDETIGWIYQYYNSREEISAMRDASSAPRNSQELAVRNQFFTPRYVVQFLTDNSLGRIWYEMTKGNTGLSETCQYLIRRTKELFLDKGNTRPENADEETDYVDHRPIKDPREILMLDPACGSMHFGLYCFDLFEHIYTEAWDNYPELLTDLRNNMTRSAFLKQIPELIIRHNIHGVDIDPRALQIAGLSLWLRAQKSFDKQNLNANQRPQITRSNLVLAEPMPGSIETLSQLVQPLDVPMRKLVLAIWDKMKLAGETGLLLRIEEEIDKTINEIAKELTDGKMSAQLSIGADAKGLKAAERAAIYSTKQYRERFLNSAETEVLKMLKQLAETATEGDAYQTLLFADDTARGFAFIELVKKKYDVVVMNPPFGASTLQSKIYIDKQYPFSKHDLAAAFIDRALNLNNSKGKVGSITTRTIFFLTSFSKWRISEIIEKNRLNIFADLGYGVLDAMVETSAYILSKNGNQDKTLFIRASKTSQKAAVLNIDLNKYSENIFKVNPNLFGLIEGSPFCYFIDTKTIKLFENKILFKNKIREAKEGLNTTDNWRYIRNHWEVDYGRLGIVWKGVLQSDRSSRYFEDFITVVYWKDDGFEIKQKVAQTFGSYTKRVVGLSSYFKPGLSWSFRTAYFQPHIVPEGFIPTTGRFLALFGDKNEVIRTCGFWNTALVDYWLKLGMEADSGNPKFRNGPVNNSPYPSITEELAKKLYDITIEQYRIVRSLFVRNPTGIHFTDNEIFKLNSIKLFCTKNELQIISDKARYEFLLKNSEELLFNEFEYNNTEIEDIKFSVQKEFAAEEGCDFVHSNDEVFNNLIDYILGSSFQRWDIRILKKWKHEWSDENIFKTRKHSPFLFGANESTLDLVLPEYRKEIEIIWNEPYPIECFQDNASSKDIVNKLKEVIIYFWPFSASTIEFELHDHFGVNNLETIFNNPNKFFDSHLKNYSRNKRISPIYWPISTASGSYTIWLYYPKMNDQTLFKVVNDYILPKQLEVAEQIKKLENNSDLDNKGKKELLDNQNLFHELKDMEKDLLEVAGLPYKPNHDDGVLITAAPLYKFFRHTKWKKSTEECWKSLQKGEYDWAHLAHSIWPERVAQKCKKDLSMAIAHGLEEICEVKPKEKKEKKAAKPAQQIIQGKLID